MMYFGPRKLLLDNVSINDTSRILPHGCTPGLGCQDSSTNPYYNYWLPAPPPPPPGQKNTAMPTFLIPMLCILGAAFVVLCYLTILKRYRSNQSNSNQGRVSSFAVDDGGSRQDLLDEIRGPVLDHPIWYIHTVGLQQSVIDSIPVFKYKRYERLVDGTDCSVCLSEFEDDETLRLLPKCSHAFHITCIDTWLRSHTNCPLCRAPIVRDVSTSPNDERNALNPGQSSSALENPGSREDATNDEHQQNVEAGEGEASGLRIGGGETLGPIWNELGKILERNSGIRALSDLGDINHVRVGEDVQSVRRSFSMDLPSASRIYAEAAKIQPVKEEGCSSIRGETEVKQQDLRIDIGAVKQGNKNSSTNRSRRSFSFGQSLQSVPIRMKRSLSTRGKPSLCRNSRSQELFRTI